MRYSLKLKAYFWFLFILVFGLVGCMASTKEIETLVATPSTIEPTKINQQLETTMPTSVLPTQTIPSPSASVTPTHLPSPTPTKPLATATITPFPTLSIEREEMILSELMQTNGGCDLPCWWGVTPGSTTVHTAKDMFISWGISWNDGYVAIGRPRHIGVYSEFIVEDNIVQQIVADGTRDRYDLTYRFTEIWQHYMVVDVLERFGMPSHIFLTPPVFAEAGVPNEYQLLLYFAPSDVKLSYIIAAEHLDGGNNRICSDFEDVQSIYLRLYAPGELREDEASLQSSLENSILWETATGLSLEEFYEMFKDEDIINCIEVD